MKPSNRRAFRILAAAIVLAAVGAAVYLLRDGAGSEPEPEGPPDSMLNELTRPDGSFQGPGPSEAEARQAGVRGKENILFWRGIHNASTAPFLVLVTIADASTSTSTRTCVEGNRFLQALAIERGLDRHSGSGGELIQFAIAQPRQEFTFTRPEALKLVAREYDDKLLREIREGLDKLTDAEILDGGGWRTYWLLGDTREPEYRGRFHALGHALLERGFLPGRGCANGELFVVK